jgi:hypothetical protein
VLDEPWPQHCAVPVTYLLLQHIHRYHASQVQLRLLLLHQLTQQRQALPSGPQLPRLGRCLLMLAQALLLIF